MNSLVKLGFTECAVALVRNAIVGPVVRPENVDNQLIQNIECKETVTKENFDSKRRSNLHAERHVQLNPDAMLPMTGGVRVHAAFGEQSFFPSVSHLCVQSNCIKRQFRVS